MHPPDASAKRLSDSKYGPCTRLTDHRRSVLNQHHFSLIKHDHIYTFTAETGAGPFRTIEDALSMISSMTALSLSRFQGEAWRAHHMQSTISSSLSRRNGLHLVAYRDQLSERSIIRIKQSRSALKLNATSWTDSLNEQSASSQNLDAKRTVAQVSGGC